MITFSSDAARYLIVGGVAVAGLVLLLAGYQLGRWIATMNASKRISEKEQELFTTQKGFKTLYEQELQSLKQDKARLEAESAALKARVEEYRRKAAGYGGLFNSGGKRADAMYALLLENESLEEALHRQGEKLQAERGEAVKESLRNTGYRRVLLSQLMNDDRIKQVVSEILSSERRLPDASVNAQHALTDQGEVEEDGAGR